MTARFSGKIAIVTGSGQGIGKGVAIRLAGEGARVVLGDRSEQVVEVAEQITASGGSAEVVLGDLEKPTGGEELAGRALDLYGRIDILVNNVGGTIWRKPFEHYSYDEITAEIQRSLFPTLWCSHAVLPAMIAQRKGVTVNVSSNATRSVNRVPYAAAKGGVNALTASLAFEAAGKGIRVVATAPGGTTAPDRVVSRHPGEMTDDEKTWHEETVRQSTDSTFQKRYGTIDEQVEPIIFLASDAAGYITGTILPVAGGDQG